MEGLEYKENGVQKQSPMKDRALLKDNSHRQVAHGEKGGGRSDVNAV